MAAVYSSINAFNRRTLQFPTMSGKVALSDMPRRPQNPQLSFWFHRWITQTVTTSEGRAYVFIAVDHCSGEFIGTHASSSASRWEALEPVRQGVTQHFGGVGPDVAKGLTLRHDHGSNYMADDLYQAA